MHVAAAVGTKTVSIFGPTEPKLLKPYGEKHIALYTKKRCVPDYSNKKYADKNFNCHPCYTQIIGKFKYECKTRECMRFITVKEVESSLYNLLEFKF
jgi:ADP-heptose:LPS heptosyltransferase